MSVTHSTYSEIARKHNQIMKNQYLKLQDPKFDSQDDNTYYDNLQEKIEIESEITYSFLIVVTFSAMCLESFIYDYAATFLTDSYVQNYIDKLDVISKWVIVPRLIAGKEISRDKQAFQLLKETIKVRNDFVHSKSKAWNPSEFKKIAEKSSVLNYVNQAERCILAIDKLAIELENIHPDSLACFQLCVKR